VRHAQRGLPQAERAVLVAVEFTGERRKLTAAARLARKAAAVSAGTALHTDGERSSAETKREADLDFNASLAEFEELARSAGAEVAATLVQHRPRPDPATLVGGGKLEEIEGVIASTEADLVLFDPETIRDMATYANPVCTAEGIAAVWVNGVLSYRDRAPTGARGGRFLRRSNAVQPL